MLSKTEIEKFKSTLGFNLGQVEKDYLQHLFLLFLTRYVKDELIFKGGTSLQKCYGLNRFSEDLDFTLVKGIDLGSLIKKITKDISNFGFKTEYILLKSKTSKNYRLMIRGPLYDGSEISLASLRIEISLREDLFLKPVLKEIVPIYTDTQPYLILTMDAQEILAEKIRTILQREKARDVYDVWFLIKKGIEIDYNLIKKKAQFYKLKFNKNVFFKRIKKVEKIWKHELSGYVSLLPEFNIVIKDIKSNF